MSINQAYLGELDQESKSARATLERVPFDKADWKPHEKSFAMLSLATHLANIFHWGSVTLSTEELNLTPDYKEEPPASKEELMARFDKNVSDFKAALAGASDEAMMTPWTLKVAGQPLFTMPRVAVLRGMVMNHMVHHRAQLGVYLRLNDIPVPSVYGPSADEGNM